MGAKVSGTQNQEVKYNTQLMYTLYLFELIITCRRFFNGADFFLYMVNVSTGLFSALWRLMKGLMIGLFYIGRMDRCVLMSGFEEHDLGTSVALSMGPFRFSFVQLPC